MDVWNLWPRISGDTSSTADWEFYEEDGAPKDLSDVVGAHVQFRYGGSNGKLTGDYTLGAGLSWKDQVGGVITWDEVESLDWRVGRYYYDLEFEFTGGNKKTWVGGTMQVDPSVTKAVIPEV